MWGCRRVAKLRSRMESEQRGRNPPAPAGEAADGPAADTRSAVTVTETGEAETTEQRLDTGVSEARVPTWVWIVLGALGLAMVAVTLALFAEARDASAQAEDCLYVGLSAHGPSHRGRSDDQRRARTRSTSSSSPPPPPFRPRCRRHRRRKSSPNAHPRTNRAHDAAEVLHRRGAGLRLRSGTRARRSRSLRLRSRPAQIRRRSRIRRRRRSRMRLPR